MINITKKIKEINNIYNDNLNKARILSLLRFIDFILVIALLCFKGKIFISLALIFIILFIVLVFISNKYTKKVDYYERYLKVLDTYDKRIKNKWDTFKDNGSNFINDKNLYLQDLDIIGNHSLYQYLNSAVTIEGKNNLYNALNNPKLDNEELLQRQNLIKKIKDNPDFIFNFLTLLSYLDEDVSLNNNIKCLKEKIKNNFFLSLTILGNLLSLITLLLSIINNKYLPIFFSIVIIKYCFSYIYGLYYKNELKNISIISDSAIKLTNILEYLSSNKIDNPVLNKIKNNSSDSLKIIKNLDSMAGFAHLKENFIANFIFNGIFTIDPYILYKYYQILEKDKTSLYKSIKDLSYLEMIISLSNIAILKNNICIPNRCDDISLEFENIKHPLLEEDKCIANDFKNNSGVFIITGSNMSGKTSFLRTIGINLILANAGTYTCATKFSSSYLKIFTSMRVQDNIELGISTFYGELLRIKDAIEYQKTDNNMIVLVDEIFKGTNYNDRILGATKVIEKLNKDNVILFITTHDFELCDEKNVLNYYFTEEYDKDNIKFDYKIRIGKCKTTNAKYLMKRLHIID